MTIAPPVRDAVLVPWLASLRALSAVAALQALLVPSGPQVGELPQATLQAALRRSGLEAQPLPSRPAQRQADMVLSPQLGWRLSNGSNLWLVQGSVRHYQDLQAAALARVHPDLRLEARRLDAPIPGSASGRIDGLPAVQTCLVPQIRGLPLAGVTTTSLVEASNPRRLLPELRDPSQWSPILVSLLIPRRFTCVLVTLRSDSSRPLPPQLWPHVLGTLRAALQPSTPR